MDGMISLAGFLSEKVTTCIGQEPFNSVYTIEGDIARGKFAVVKRCRHCITGQEFAAKFLRKRRLGRDVRHEILHEMAVLEMGLTNPRIINLHEVYETNRELILVLELATGGELQQLIDELDECLKERDVIRLMRQILEGLSFLHDRNIVHLDIKPQNILLSTSFPHGDVKLCDFGISRLVSSGCEVREILGTPDYVAPEILSYEPISTVTDMWSIGVLAYVLLTGHSPFAGENKQETYCNIAQCNLDFPEELFNEVSLQAQDFIRRLLIRDPASRSTARDCLLHPWLRPETELALVRSPFGSPSLRRPHPPCDQENLADEGGFPKRPKFSEGFDGGFMFDEGVVC